MAGPYLTDDALADAIASDLQRQSAADLEPFWAERIAAANTMAYSEIVARLTARGYPPSAIDSWDNAVNYSRTLGRFFALRDAGMQYGVLPEVIKMLDVRKDLDTLMITVGGVPLAPASPTAAGAFGIGYGTLTALTDPCTGRNRFDRPDPRGLF